MSDTPWRHMTDEERAINEPIIKKHVDPLFARIADLEAQVSRLRAFGEEMSWYAPEEDWQDAAHRQLHYGDVRTIPEIRRDPVRDEGDAESI